MKQLLSMGEAFVQRMNWKEVGIFKLCLACLGMFIGLMIPKKAKSPCAIVSGILFLVSYVILIAKLLHFFFGTPDED